MLYTVYIYYISLMATQPIIFMGNSNHIGCTYCMAYTYCMASMCSTGCTACGGREGGAYVCLYWGRLFIYRQCQSSVGLAWRVFCCLYTFPCVCVSGSSSFLLFVLFCLHGVGELGRDVYITNEEEPSAASSKPDEIWTTPMSNEKNEQNVI